MNSAAFKIACSQWANSIEPTGTEADSVRSRFREKASKLLSGDPFASQEQPDEATDSYVLYSSSYGERSVYTFMYRCFAQTVASHKVSNMFV